MFPLIAVGALITGTLLLNSTSESPRQASRTRQKSSEDRNPSVSPQAYVVIPMNDAEQSAQRVDKVSMLDQVRKFIF